MTTATRAHRLLQALAEHAHAERAARSGGGTPAWVDFFGAARALVDVRAVDVAFAERLSRWVRGFAPDNLPHPEPRAAPTYLRCVPISAALDCGLGDGWDALTVELLADAVEINVTGPFPRSAAERDATRSVLLSWTLVDAPATTYAATSLHSSGDGWGLASLTLDTPGLHGNAAVELRNGKRRCLQFDANGGLPFGQRPLRRRALTGEDVVRNSLKASLEGLGDIVAGIALAERLRYLEASVRRHAEDSLRLSGWLIEIDALASDSPLLDQLNEAIAQPIEWLRKAHLESVADGAPPVRNDERVLRRVVPIATDVTVGGVPVAVRWMAVFTDLVMVAVTVFHGDPTGHDDGVGQVRWRLEDRWGWSRALQSLNDWCGRPWTAFYLYAQPPFWKGKRVHIVADAGGEEVFIPVEAGFG